MPAWSLDAPEPGYVRRRVRRLELMDQGGLDAGERAAALAGLERISAWPGQRGSVLAALLRLLGRPDGRRLKLVELGAGNGSLSRWVRRSLDRRGYRAEVLATDVWPAPGVRRLDAVNGARLPDADVYFSNLLLHHLDDKDVPAMLRRQCRVSRLGWAHLDLHRHWLHFHAASLILRAARLPRINRVDGRRSIQQGFTRFELEALAGGAGPAVRLVWRAPFRWELSWTRN